MTGCYKLCVNGLPLVSVCAKLLFWHVIPQRGEKKNHSILLWIRTCAIDVMYMYRTQDFQKAFCLLFCLLTIVGNNVLLRAIYFFLLHEIYDTHFSVSNLFRKIAMEFIYIIENG